MVSVFSQRRESSSRRDDTDIVLVMGPYDRTDHEFHEDSINENEG